MVFYRKYRPQKISELDIESVRNRLSTVLSSGRSPHAFLFSGPKGTGKTSAARIAAKVINCESRINPPDGGQELKIKNIEPCNKCEVCVSITEGRNMDVLEIDAASNRGIDEIRDLKEKIRLSPSFARFKVYIIDEVHMLTTEAFNALLKTLEEPPSHAIFILATTEPEKLIPTIVSRCLPINFTKATDSEIVHSLKRVVVSEKLKIKDEDIFLRNIAQASEGSFRDAAKILEQAVLEDALSSEKLAHILGFVSTPDVSRFLTFLKNHDSKKALEELSKMDENGVNYKLFTSSILHFLHSFLLAKYGIEGNIDSRLGDMSVGDIETLLRLFTRAYSEFRSAVIPVLPLEMVVVEWGEMKVKSS